MSSNFQPSKYQLAIFDHIRAQRIGEQAGAAEGQAHAIIEAVAGSGKTTTIVQALELTQHPAVFLAFNKAIAEELKRRVPPHVQARTFHSLCYRPVLQATGARDVNTSKLQQVVKFAMPLGEAAMYGAFVRRLVGLARQSGLGALQEASDEAFYALVEHHDITLEHERASEEKGIHYAQRILELSNESRDVDFDDLLYQAVLRGVKLPTFKWVFVDEGQDTNMIQRAIIRKILEPGGRLVVVGDAAQAIYGFRGADSDSLNLIASEFAPCVRLPLSVTYRCAAQITARAKTYVPTIEPRDGAPEGVVEELGMKWKLTDLGCEDLVVCRNTKPLLDLGYRLMRAKIPLRIMGRDIGEGLVALIRKCNGGTGLDTMLEALSRWQERETQKAIAKGNDAKADAITDKAGAVQMLASSLPEGERSTEALIVVIQSLFTEANSRVTLATVHKAKGLEADCVWWLAPSLCPSRWARKPWQQQQERNVMYVATTRAKTRLVLMELAEKGAQQ